MNEPNQPHLSAWGTTDHSQGSLFSLTQDRVLLITYFANRKQFGPRSKVRDNWDRGFLEGRRNMMTKYNHSPSSRPFHGASSPESTFQLSRKDPLSPHIHPEGWFSLYPHVRRWAAVYGVTQSRTRLKWLSSSSKGANWGSERWRDIPVTHSRNGANSPVCHRWGEVLPLWREGPAPVLLLLFSHLVRLFATLWMAAHWLSCASLSPGVCSNSCPLSQWSHPTILRSAVPFPSCLQSLQYQSLSQWVGSSLPSEYFPMSQLFPPGGQSIGDSASASVLPMNIQDWFLLGLTGLISLQSKRLSRVFSNNTVQKHQFFSTQPSLWSNSHIHTWLLEKP